MSIKVIGLKADEAEKRLKAIGMRYRVVCIDGRYTVVTRDVRTDRVNVNIENGIVTKAHIG